MKKKDTVSFWINQGILLTKRLNGINADGRPKSDCPHLRRSERAGCLFRLSKGGRGNSRKKNNRPTIEKTTEKRVNLVRKIG